MGTELFGSQFNFLSDDEEKHQQKPEPEAPQAGAPLATLLRPQSLDDFIGQEHIVGKGRLLRKLIEHDRVQSLIFYGPPGVGKTSLAHIISCMTKAHFTQMNAVLASVADIKAVLATATRIRGSYPDKRVVLFVDEIHRFNKAQQDVLMPSVESGLIALIGATTHNPFFAVNGPLLSRSMIFELKALEEDDLVRLVERGIAHYQAENKDITVQVDDSIIRDVAGSANGDARRALTILELSLWLATHDESVEVSVLREHVVEAAQKRIVTYDKDGDGHYDTISAFIKSLRGSDPDAAVYWLAKMLYAGEDIRFIMRRMLIFASEDIGNADPRALLVASSALNAVEFVGMPEARIILSHCATYLATAPKSNAAYMAISKAQSVVASERTEEVPSHLKGTGYAGAAQLGHGDGYKYPHDYEGNYVEQQYRMGQERFYEPTEHGYEKTIRALMQARCGEK